MIEGREYIYPYLGIEFAHLTPDLMEEAYEESPHNLVGVLVNSIDKDSPAHKAGINARITNQFGNITGGDIICNCTPLELLLLLIFSVTSELAPHGLSKYMSKIICFNPG